MRLIWVRHGETAWNRDFRLQGTSDVDLSEIGLWQAQQLANSIMERPRQLYVSPLQRTLAFAAPLAARYNLQPFISEDLREMSFGSWEGLRYADMLPADQQLFEAWCLDPVNVSPPAGEPVTALAQRVGRFLSMVQAALTAEEIAVVVTHGGIIRVAVMLAMHLPVAAVGRMQINTASITVLDNYDGAWHLVKLNDTCHLLK